ncbi:aminotransferase class I/II-fold pyridoxal phosphate-dependent enzyme [Sphingomicrobium clamense]|uniref:Aminotransferase class I/II-fold pyridoxal phosphate-dependent enzyme n=1 Tax=Sphingomicrobium clamense TaxID=2851013 RepID=A0ABS6V761_9SPHN|nr:aminotransferase class I/II-fold pyridoxal phosphate-dependent enzyme [Sphingomicrobium sp. B8]MBW0145344.1 aminotransferase class I/II-fold pyridoxal phosphate-dependent enzyme [Sphingomicrobium sp. B8]
MNPLYEQMDVSVFERMSLAAAQHGAANLGQGFPDFGWPDSVLEAAARHTTEGYNQYPPSRGLPALREAVANHYRARHGIAITPDHVTVTSGATEAICSAILAIVEPGDEVILLAPAFDVYAPMIRRAGGTPVEVRLEAPSFRLDADALSRAVTPATRLIIFNNPHNPTGRLFDRNELQALADVAIAHDLLVLSDEVWEEILFGDEFTTLLAVDGMAERTIKCGSAGKIFSLTGWKVGWMVASPSLSEVLAKAHQFVTFATPPNLQAAVADGLADPGWIPDMRTGFARARDRLIEELDEAGYASIRPEATYFMTVDLAASGIDLDDEAFAKRAVEEAGVAVVPMSPFYLEKPPTNLIRLCFAKKDATLDAGIEGLARAARLVRD